MRTAHVNEAGIVLRYEFSENLTPQDWETMLDQLKSQHLPSLYQHGKRMHVAPDPSGKCIVGTIYLTPQMVKIDSACDILHHWGFDVHDARTEVKG